MARPHLLMVDELSLGLAPIVVDAIYEAVSRVRERGMTVLIVEQDVLIALEQADRGYVLDVGQITMGGGCPGTAGQPASEGGLSGTLTSTSEWGNWTEKRLSKLGD
jgi:branched-chain amino acid transport system ATP-binding protein